MSMFWSRYSVEGRLIRDLVNDYLGLLSQDADSCVKWMGDGGLPSICQTFSVHKAFQRSWWILASADMEARYLIQTELCYLELGDVRV